MSRKECNNGYIEDNKIYFNDEFKTSIRERFGFDLKDVYTFEDIHVLDGDKGSEEDECGEYLYVRKFDDLVLPDIKFKMYSDSILLADTGFSYNDISNDKVEETEEASVNEEE